MSMGTWLRATTGGQKALTLKSLGFEEGETVESGAKRLGLPDKLVRLATRCQPRWALDAAALDRPITGNEQTSSGFAAVGLLLQRELLSQRAELEIANFVKTAKPPSASCYNYDDTNVFVAFCEDIGVLAGQTSHDAVRVQLALLVNTDSSLLNIYQGEAMTAAIGVLESIAVSVGTDRERLSVIERIPLSISSPSTHDDAVCAQNCIRALGRIAAKSNPAVVEVIAAKLEAIAKSSPSSHDHEGTIHVAVKQLQALGRDVAIAQREKKYALPSLTSRA
jgi:hypothetical protein